MTKSLVYLDYNATAPIYPEVVTLMGECMASPSNPSSVHHLGRHAKKRLEDARKTIASTISAWPKEITFTSSGTEANITALRSLPKRRILVSAVEHSSVLKAVNNPETIAVDDNGIVKLDALEQLLQNKPEAIVSVMLANNETGVIQPIAEIAQLCKQHDALLHCDAVQGLGKIPVDFSLLGVDMMSISGHKCGGPLGAAALIVRQDLAFVPLMTGGGQELGKRAGTENIAAIAGFALAVEKSANLQLMSDIQHWLHDMESTIEAQGGIIIGKNTERLPNTSNIIMPGITNEVQLMDFDLNGFAVSAGSACSSGRIEASHVLKAMGMDTSQSEAAIRISAGWNNSQQDIKAITDNWVSLHNRLIKNNKSA